MSIVRKTEDEAPAMIVASIAALITLPVMAVVFVFVSMLLPLDGFSRLLLCILLACVVAGGVFGATLEKLRQS